MIPNQKQKSVNLHDFSMTPSADVPRSQFNLSHGRKVPFSFSNLIPILVEFVLPGDTWNCRISTAARTATPIVPVQDNWRLNFFSFFVPMRLVWSNTEKFFGEQTSPGDSIAYTIPQLVSTAGGYAIGTLQDYMGLPTAATAIGGGATYSHNVLPLRAYNLIYNEWFRDENLQNYVGTLMPAGDGPDSLASYAIQKRGKRFDYFTQALPWPQKGNTAITVPIGTSAIVRTNVTEFNTGSNPAGTGVGMTMRRSNLGTTTNTLTGTNAGALSEASATGQALTSNVLYPTNLYADLSTATGATINALRSSIALQQYLEKDARGGTRYNEHVWNHYKVRTADARLDRPEFVGGGVVRQSTRYRSRRHQRQASPGPRHLSELWPQLDMWEAGLPASLTAPQNTAIYSPSAAQPPTSPTARACAECGACPPGTTCPSHCSPTSASKPSSTKSST